MIDTSKISKTNVASLALDKQSISSTTQVTSKETSVATSKVGTFLSFVFQFPFQLF